MAAPWRASWWRSPTSRHTMRHAVSSASTLNSRDRVSPAVVRLLMGGCKGGRESRFRRCRAHPRRPERATRRRADRNHPNGLAAPGDRPHPRGDHPAPSSPRGTHADQPATVRIPHLSRRDPPRRRRAARSSVNGRPSTPLKSGRPCAPWSRSANRSTPVARSPGSICSPESLAAGSATPRFEARSTGVASRARSRAQVQLSVLRRQRWLWRGRPYGEAVDEFVISLVLAEQRERAASTTVEEAEPWPNASELAAVEADIAALTRAAKGKEITVSTLLQLLPDLGAPA